MSFVLKAGVVNRPLPAFRNPNGCRYEYVCGWCDESFMTAPELVAHVKEARDHV